MKIKYWLLLIISAGIALRIFDLIMVPPIDLDGIEYARIAKLFADGDFGSGIKSMRVPFYPMMVACFHLLVGDIELAGRLVSLFFGLLLIPLCYLFVRRIFDEEGALFAAAVVAIHPYLVRYSVFVLSESMATFLFTASVFSFYRGWMEKKLPFLACSGVLLTLAYLTRPEYLIYFVPLAGILIVRERRYLHAGVFVVSFLWLAAAFVIFVRLDTGFWVIDRRMLLWQQQADGVESSLRYLIGAMSPLGALTNLPAVIAHFCEAICIPFFFLACFGFAGMQKPYRVLLLMLVATHILGRSFVPHSTERYSVEFIPIVMVLAGEGARVVGASLSRCRHGKLLATLFFFAIVLVAFVVGLNAREPRRELEKQAGLLLRSKGAKVVAARFPRSTFYARADWIDLTKMAETTGNCQKLMEGLRVHKVEYMVSDRGMERDTPLVRNCLAGATPIASFVDHENYVRVYGLESFMHSP
jgi:4-amino-4-deoxy-L-arabinose transferase-like glycosyltransferase